MSKELFDRSLNATPDLATKRLAFGDPDNLAENITFQQHIDLLNTNLFNNANNSFSLIRVGTNFTVTSATAFYRKVGKVVFLEVQAVINVVSSTGNAIQLQESGTDNAALRPQTLITDACGLTYSTNRKVGTATLLTAGSGADRFIIQFTHYDNATIATGSHTITYRTVYQCI